MVVNLIFALSALGIYFAESAHMRKWPDHNGSHVNQSTSQIDPMHLSELRRRNVPLVDTAAIPTTGCFENDCNDPQPPGAFSSGPLIPQCHLIPVPCRPDQDETECYSWELDCFCNAPEPLWCGWECDWARWFKAEDWCKLPLRPVFSDTLLNSPTYLLRVTSYVDAFQKLLCLC